jgi:microcin C transport system substrate-binding protein
MMTNQFKPFRCFVLCVFLVSFLVQETSNPARAQNSTVKSGDVWSHALSLMGEPKYGQDFPYFGYVNPKAPKGGILRLGAQGGFDNLNLFVAGVKGELEDYLSQIYDTLLVQSYDEVSTGYGLLAEAVQHPADKSTVTYRLRSQARWHDGKPVTVEDVLFSLETLRKHSPRYAAYFRNVVRAEKTGEREVTFGFDQANNRELPQILGQFPILPKHFWEGKDVSQTTLAIPLGSGPYRLKSVTPGRQAVYERVPDYWGKDLPVNIGKHNFDSITVEYFRDSTVLMEAFKGDQYDWRFETIARNWTQGYEFPAVREGRVLREEFPLRQIGVMQAFVFNLRKDVFKDERVRRAFNHVFDFEDINRTLFFGQYERIVSYFSGTELASPGLPQGHEKAILESVRDKIPASVFTTPYANPVNGSPSMVRENLREAVRLLQEAGYEQKDGKMISKTTGEPLVVEFLSYDASFERFVLPYAQALARIGVTLKSRMVDLAQYGNRVRQFDFDIIMHSWGQSLSPGNEQRDLWGSQAANRPGSQNVAGISDPGIDALIEKVIFATDRETLVAATHALDRVLLAHNYVVPQWRSAVTRVAYWNRFSRPETLPVYVNPAFPMIWWWESKKTSQTGMR